LKSTSDEDGHDQTSEPQQIEGDHAETEKPLD